MPLASIDKRRLYRQIADQISRLIDAGEYVAGKRLPTVGEALIAFEGHRGSRVVGLAPGAGLPAPREPLPQRSGLPAGNSRAPRYPRGGQAE